MNNTMMGRGLELPNLDCKMIATEAIAKYDLVEVEGTVTEKTLSHVQVAGDTTQAQRSIFGVAQSAAATGELLTVRFRGKTKAIVFEPLEYDPGRHFVQDSTNDGHLAHAINGTCDSGGTGHGFSGDNEKTIAILLEAVDDSSDPITATFLFDGLAGFGHNLSGD